MLPVSSPAKITFAMHASTRDDFFANLLSQPSPIGIGDKVRFDHSTQLWHIWDGVRWAPDMTTMVFELIRDQMMLWLSDHDRVKDKDDMKLYSVLFDYGKKVSVLKSLASMPAVSMKGDEWDPDPNLVGFKNGVLDLQTLSFDAQPSPSLLVSRSTGVDWDPQADMRPFTDFVTGIMSNDADLTDYLMTVLGYAMTGANREQKFWMWVGSGQNGKGVLARTVAKALGDYAATPPDTLYMKTRYGAASSDKPRPELLKLQGARFTYMSEPQGGQFNEEMLKAHSGNDLIEARTLYAKNFKTFSPTHKIIFLTNNPPRTEDVGPSMQRRVRLIWFEQDYRDPSRDDKGLEDRLKETPNLQGALRVMAMFANHYLNNGMTEPQKVLGWSKAYIEDNDPIAAFLSESCVIANGSSELSGHMWKSFEAWCEKSGSEKWTRTGFGIAFSRRFPKVHRNTGTHYSGVRLKNITDQTDEDGNDN